MKRILIIGLQGAGKSTLANNLGKKLQKEVIHLDKFYYPNDKWIHSQTKAEWRDTVTGLANKEEWIMDGNFHSTLDIRIPRADTVIFLNFNKLLCLYRIFKRKFTSNGQPFDKADGAKERVSWGLIMKIVKFPIKKTFERLEEYKDSKQIYVLRNDKEVEDLLTKLN